MRQALLLMALLLCGCSTPPASLAPSATPSSLTSAQKFTAKDGSFTCQPPPGAEFDREQAIEGGGCIVTFQSKDQEDQWQEFYIVTWIKRDSDKPAERAKLVSKLKEGPGTPIGEPVDVEWNGMKGIEGQFEGDENGVKVQSLRRLLVGQGKVLTVQAGARKGRAGFQEHARQFMESIQFLQ